MDGLFKIVDGVEVPLTAEETAAWVALQETPEQHAQRLIEELSVAVQKSLDDEAKTHNYDGILSACSYATSTNPRFSAEGQACVAWREAVWAECYTILGLVQAGQRTPPTISELLAALPVMTWPVV